MRGWAGAAILPGEELVCSGDQWGKLRAFSRIAERAPGVLSAVGGAGPWTLKTHYAYAAMQLPVHAILGLTERRAISKRIFQLSTSMRDGPA